MNRMKWLCSIVLLMGMLPQLLLAQKTDDRLRDGNRQYNSGNYARAEASYRAAVKANDTSYKANFNLGDALYQQGRYEEAAKQFDKAAGLAKEKMAKANAYFNQGNSWLKGNKLDESIAAYKNALRLDPGNTAAQYNLSYAMLKKKQQQQKQQQQNQQNQNQQNQNKQNQQQKPQPQQNQQQQPKQSSNNQEQQSPDKISKSDAERMLNAVKKQEEDLRKRLYQGNQTETPSNNKPW